MQIGAWVKKVLKKKKEGDSKATPRWTRFLSMWNIPVLLMGFLLGRAMILDAISPFAIAYLAVIFHLSRKQWPWVMMALLTGALTLSVGHAAHTLGCLIVFLAIQKSFYWIGRGQINYVPFIVFLSSVAGHLVRLSWDGWTMYKGMLASVDVLLSFILTFIFVQALPLFTVKKHRITLRHEEMICLIILVGSVMTGLLDWHLWELSAVNIFSRFLILALAFVGGAMLGSSMGVVMGMIMSLSDTRAVLQISFLAFAGLLAGLFKDGKRLGVGIGFLLGSAILSLYESQTPMMWISLQESCVAIFLFLIAPAKWFKVVARYVPGTTENQGAQHDYIRKLRDVTAYKVEQFTELFRELSFSFKEDPGKVCKEDEALVHGFVAQVIETSCKGCARYQHCWEQNVMKTYQGMTDLMAQVETAGALETTQAPVSWTSHCIQHHKVLQIIQDQYAHHEETALWKDRMKDARRIVSQQLSGMAEVMGKLSKEIRHETEVLSAQEDHIYDALEEMGLSIQRVNVINLEEGRVEIEVVMPQRDAVDECKKIVAPLLSEILGEPITVFRKVVHDRSTGAAITLGSAQRYELRTGVASAAKGGGFVSGDSYCFMNLGTGKYAVALSDGMGNGGRAQEESHAALKLLRRLLQAGMNEEKAVETINSILSLRSSDEMFATIDLALVDLNTAQGRFMKIGSTPGFIKRGKKVMVLSASNLPIGILSEIDIEPIEMQLQSGDLMIMVTDGIYDAPGHSSNKDALISRFIAEIDTKDPQDFADCLLEKVVRYRGGQIEDDMTVVVSKVERHVPEWSTIRLPGVNRLERPQHAI